MPERLNQVQVVTFRGLVTITWDARGVLLHEMRHLDSLRPVKNEFENAGCSRPVVIPQDLKLGVVQVIETMGANAVGGLVNLEGGLFELRNALVDEFAATA